MKKRKLLDKKLLVGWAEWCALPKLKIPAVKAKIDTGAQTSAIHALNIETYRRKNKKFVRFDFNPLPGKYPYAIPCHAEVIDKRYIMSSNGHKEHRYVIQTTLTIAGIHWEIQLTLSNRDPLRFRMLLGREALTHHTIIDTGLTCNQNKISKSQLREIYSES